LNTTFAALADPTRRQILGRLAEQGEANVTELAEPFPITVQAVSQHLKVLEQAGLIERTGHPGDLRAVQLRLTDQGADIARRAIAIVAAFQEELTAPIGGTQSQPARDLVRILQTLLGSEHRSDTMAPSAILTGQDVELDTRVLDTVADSLRHLVTNAVDHGCESPAQRIQADVLASLPARDREQFVAALARLVGERLAEPAACQAPVRRTT
jgi:DNA-binding MarR family transcriptional regulator